MSRLAASVAAASKTRVVCATPKEIPGHEFLCIFDGIESVQPTGRVVPDAGQPRLVEETRLFLDLGVDALPWHVFKRRGYLQFGVDIGLMRHAVLLLRFGSLK
jgi:hypothetical protein